VIDERFGYFISEACFTSADGGAVHDGEREPTRKPRRSALYRCAVLPLTAVAAVAFASPARAEDPPSPTPPPPVTEAESTVPTSSDPIDPTVAAAVRAAYLEPAAEANDLIVVPVDARTPAQDETPANRPRKARHRTSERQHAANARAAGWVLVTIRPRVVDVVPQPARRRVHATGHRRAERWYQAPSPQYHPTSDRARTGERTAASPSAVAISRAPTERPAHALKGEEIIASNDGLLCKPFGAICADFCIQDEDSKALWNSPEISLCIPDVTVTEPGADVPAPPSAEASEDVAPPPAAEFECEQLQYQLDPLQYQLCQELLTLIESVTTGQKPPPALPEPGVPEPPVMPSAPPAPPAPVSTPPGEAVVPPEAPPATPTKSVGRTTKRPNRHKGEVVRAAAMRAPVAAAPSKSRVSAPGVAAAIPHPSPTSIDRRGPDKKSFAGHVSTVALPAENRKSSRDWFDISLAGLLGLAMLALAAAAVSGHPGTAGAIAATMERARTRIGSKGLSGGDTRDRSKRRGSIRYRD
jgi:hypothetical protein